MGPKDKKQQKVDATRRAMISALGVAPVILTLVPGQARAEYFAGEYYDGSCDAPPPQAGRDFCKNPDTPPNGN